MRRATFALLAAIWIAAPVAVAAPPRLSYDAPRESFDSSYGGGNLGSWSVDRYGLPRYAYKVDEAADPRAAQPELAGSTLAQHQVGNDHIIASAYNDGFTQLWSQDRLAQWVDRYDPANKHYGGGFGYLNLGGGRVLSTLYPDRAAGASFAREFGVGYMHKRVAAEGFDVSQTTFAPFGDDPLLLDEVTITNKTAAPANVSWLEYWDVNPYDQQLTAPQHQIGIAAPTWNAATRTLSVDQITAVEGDGRPLTVFAAALSGPLEGFESSADAFFGSGTRALPAEVASDHLSGAIAPPSPTGLSGHTLAAFRAPLHLAAGASVTLRYAYGLAHAAAIPALVNRYRGQHDPLAASEHAWSESLPKADFGADLRWVARELVWDAYLLRSSSVYEEECGHHTITQGGYYQFDDGSNWGYRSWPHYALPMTYMGSDSTREILRYSIRLQPLGPPPLQQVPYGTGQLCSRSDLGTSNDLDLWLLMAAAEYGLGMRDPHFFDEQIPYYGVSQTASAWEHVKESFAHQESLRGPNGGYIMGATGDWSDFSTEVGPMTESMLVAAQLAYVYPKLAELADLRGDTGFAAQLRARAAELKTTVAQQWTGKGWYARGYFGTRQVGAGLPYGEPQPWALLAGVPDPQRARTLVANIRRYLTGIGAPGGPTTIGSAMAPARNDPDITERGPAIDPTNGSLPDLFGAVVSNNTTAPLGGSAAYPGGAWFDVNGWLTWALAAQDGVVANARQYAWEEYTRNTLATHAAVYPNHWAGTISIDDACNAWYSKVPERCGIGLSTNYDGQITEQPTWMVMDAVRLAGVTPTRDGYDIAPHFPFEPFSLRLPRVGVAATGNSLSGYFKPDGHAPIELSVHLPSGVDPAAVVTWSGDRVVSHTTTSGVVRFAISNRWAMTWRAWG